MLASLAPWALRRRGLVLLLSAAVAAGGGVSVARLAAGLDTDSMSLLPRGLPALDALRESVSRFGSADRLYVIASPTSGGSAEDAVEGLDAVATALPPDLVGEAHARIDLGELFHRSLLPRLPLLLPEESIEELARRLEPSAIERALRLSRRRLSLTLTGSERRLVALDPLQLSLLLPPPKVAETGISIDAATGGLALADGSFLLLASPRRPATDIPFDEELRDALVRAVASAESSHPAVELSWGGAFQAALWEFEAMTGDLRVNLATSLLAVGLLFAAGFRGLRALPIAFLPLVLGILATFLVADLLALRLNSATMGFAAMLVGLGIDFGIVLLGRTLALRASGTSLEDAIATTYRGSLRGVVTGAVTTAAAFLALLPSAFPGLRQLGLLTAVGTLGCLAAAALLFPALVTWLAPRPRPLHGLGFPALSSMALGRPRSVLLGALLVSLPAVFGLTRLTLDDDMRRLRAPDNPGIAFEERLAGRLGRTTDTLLVLVKGETSQALEAAVTRAHAALSLLEERGLVAGAHGPRDLVPDPAEQGRRLEALRRKRADGSLDPARFSADFDRAARAAGFVPEALARYRDGVAAALALERPLGLSEWGASGLGLLAPAAAGDGELAAQILVDPAPGTSPEALRRSFVEASGSGEGSITMTGFVFAAQELRHQIRRDAVTIVPLGTALVVGLLWLDLRSGRKVLLALLPVGLGLLWMLGLMGLTGMSFNFFNIFVLALVQGIGVDYGVHVLHRLEETGLALGHLRDVAAAVSLAALTTVAGFGSLALCHYPALASMGIVTTLGTLGSLLAALTVLPAAYALLQQRTSSRQE